MVVDAPAMAAVRTGKFWKLLGPLCPAESFRVTPSLPRSMPRRALALIELARTALPVPAPVTATPAPALPAMRLPAPEAMPPMALFAAPPATTTPLLTGAPGTPRLTGEVLLETTVPLLPFPDE